jgi:NAD+ kinase
MIHPSVPSIGFTPISPHSLSFRPVVFPARAELRITNSKFARAPAYLSFDGKHRMELSGDDVISITTSQYPVPTVTSSDDISSWFSSLAECLHWNDRAIQNAPLMEQSNL